MGHGDEFQFGGTGFSDFFEQFFSSLGGRQDIFGRPAGLDREQEFQPARDSEAEIMVTLEEAVRGSVRPITVRRNVPCRECQGTGRVRVRRICPICGGEGRIPEVNQYQVRIPPGIREGQRLRLAGKGESGTQGGASGDLYLRVRLAKHPDFRVEGNNLYTDVDLAPWEAVLGADVTVPTLEGRLNIRIPPGAQNAQKLRVRSKGLPAANSNRGDLLVVLHIQVPKHPTEQERRLWEQLARESRFNPRE